MTAALSLLRFYQRHVSPHTRPCPTRLAGGRSCSQRMADSVATYGVLAGVAAAFGQTWLCCGNSHRSMPGHGNNRYGTAGRRNGGWN